MRSQPVLGVTVAVLATMALCPPPASAATTGLDKGVVNLDAVTHRSSVISSAGPLSQITLGPDLSCQIAYGNLGYQIYHPSTSPSDCGTFLAVGGQLYSPNFAGHGITATSALGGYTPFTRISQTPTTGSGTLTDPYIVTTVVDAGATGLRITQVDTYVTGRGDMRSDIVVTNNSPAWREAVLSRGADCYLAGSDRGTGAAASYPSSATSMAGCVSPTTGRVERMISATAGSSYVEDFYSNVWSRIGAKTTLPNTCACTSHIDNGIALAWRLSIPPQGTVIRTLRHEFTNLPVKQPDVRVEVDVRSPLLDDSEGVPVPEVDEGILVTDAARVVEALPHLRQALLGDV